MREKNQKWVDDQVLKIKITLLNLDSTYAVPNPTTPRELNLGRSLRGAPGLAALTDPTYGRRIGPNKNKKIKIKNKINE